MLNYELRHDDGLLVLKPEGPLTAADFRMLASQVDAYLDSHGALRGVLIEAREFPGWQNFGALIAHLKFVRLHHRKVEKVAVVSDSTFAKVMPHIAGHFIRAKVKHFSLGHTDEANKWLTARGRAWMRTAA